MIPRDPASPDSPIRRLAEQLRLLQEQFASLEARQVVRIREAVVVSSTSTRVTVTDVAGNQVALPFLVGLTFTASESVLIVSYFGGQFVVKVT